MDEIAVCVPQRDATAQVVSVHSGEVKFGLRNAGCSRGGAVLVENRVLVSCTDRALLHVYSLGRDSPEQKMPLPEIVVCLCQVGGFLVGAGASGKLYSWELSSGLLLSVRDAHYQRPSMVAASACGQYVVSCGADSRVVVWSLGALVGFSSDDAKPKPAHVFSDNTLEVTDLCITNSVIQDAKLYTSSRDGTVRVYNLVSGTLLTTFVLEEPVLSLAVDVAERSIYCGLASGTVRQIDLYVVSELGYVESLLGYGKVVTIGGVKENVSQTANDADQAQFSAHAAEVCGLQVLLDGSLLVSSDVGGRVLVSDISSKQVVKELKQMESCSTLILVPDFADKVIEKVRTLPVLKRVVCSGELKEKDVLHRVNITQEDDHSTLFDISEYLGRVSSEQLEFSTFSKVDSKVTTVASGPASNSELEAKLQKTTAAYLELKKMYQDLYNSK